MTARLARLLPALLLALLLGPRGAQAHPLAPAVLALREQAQTPARYDVSFRRSPLAASRLELAWPHGCRPESSRTTSRADQVEDTFVLACARPLSGQTLRVFGLVDLGIGVVVHLEHAEGGSVRALLSPEKASFTVPPRTTRWPVLCDYVGLGIEHLVTGFDHVLFIVGLVLLVPGLRARVVALTAFTVGHSITLASAALGLLRLPQAPVELGIALSLIVLALEVLALASTGSARRPRMLHAMAAGFGLLHGLGFASALADAGLPAHAVPLALLGFNLGVELGQLAIVLGLWPLLHAATRLQPARLRALVRGAGYAIGSLAAMWCIERTVLLLSLL